MFATLAPDNIGSQVRWLTCIRFASALAYSCHLFALSSVLVSVCLCVCLFVSRFSSSVVNTRKRRCYVGASGSTSQLCKPAHASHSQ